MQISLETFCNDVADGAEYFVDINSLMNVCCASPVRAKFKANKIVVIEVSPEVIILFCGGSYIQISQINNIDKYRQKNGKVAYQIVCGRLKELETTVKISQA